MGLKLVYNILLVLGNEITVFKQFAFCFILIKYLNYYVLSKCILLLDYLPLVEIDQQEYLGNFKSSIVIECSIASPDSEIHSVSWIFHDIDNDLQMQIKASSKYDIGLYSNPSLLIKNLSVSDEGLYKCIASNAFGTGYSNWTLLKVQGNFRIFPCFLHYI